MPNPIIRTSINDELNQILIAFENGEELSLNIDSDINLTPFVKYLSFTIKENQNYEIEHFQTEDPKLAIIQHTISDIVTAFNSSLTEDVEIIEENDEEVPF